jgi:hypothetical protein
MKTFSEKFTEYAGPEMFSTLWSSSVLGFAEKAAG